MSRRDSKFEWDTYNGVPVRHFDHHTSVSDVDDMTFDEAMYILSRHAQSDGREWSARPHFAKACQMALTALEEYKQNHTGQ